MFNKYLAYVQEQMQILAQDKHPDNKTLQLIYQVGFLQAQLAQAMANDNKNYYRFKDTVSANGCIVPKQTQEQNKQQKR